MKALPILVVAFTALVVLPGAGFARPGKAATKASAKATTKVSTKATTKAAGKTPVKRPPPPASMYGSTATYSLGGFYPRSPCAPGVCPDTVALSRAMRRELQRQELRRELQRQELRRELDSRAEAAARWTEPSPYLAPRYLPPPTPESHLQPRYRGTGEIRPEYRTVGRPL